MSLNDLLAMQVGDVITMDKACSRDVADPGGGEEQFLGQVGQFRGNRSVRIIRVLERWLTPPDSNTTPAATGKPEAASEPGQRSRCGKPHSPQMTIASDRGYWRESESRWQPGVPAAHDRHL